MRVISSLFIITGFVGSASGLKKPRQPRSLLSTPNTGLLNIRGGALDPASVGNTFAALVGTQSLASILCPKSTTKTCGVAANDENVITVKGAGWAQLSAAVIAYQILQGSSVNKALACGLAPMVIGNISCAVNEDMKVIGTKKQGNSMLIFWTTIQTIVAYGLFSGANWAGTSIKVLSSLILVAGLMLIMDPAGSFAQYGRTSPISADLARACEFYGVSLILPSVMTLALALGAGVVEAIGFSSVPFILYVATSLRK